jgi:hypothetical protein
MSDQLVGGLRIQTDDTGQVAAPGIKASKLFPPSAAAQRMRRHRERRRDGLQCLTVELRDTELDALVRMKLLQPEMRNSRSAILNAFYDFLDQTLDRIP